MACAVTHGPKLAHKVLVVVTSVDSRIPEIRFIAYVPECMELACLMKQILVLLLIIHCQSIVVQKTGIDMTPHRLALDIVEKKGGFLPLSSVKSSSA